LSPNSKILTFPRARGDYARHPNGAPMDHEFERIENDALLDGFEELREERERKRWRSMINLAVVLAAEDLRRTMNSTRKSENLTVLETGHIDGGAYRVVRLADGSARVEGWRGGAWLPGDATFGEIADAPPVGSAFAAKLGIPPSDLG
jgi:hypothetical protein